MTAEPQVLAFPLRVIAVPRNSLELTGTRSPGEAANLTRASIDVLRSRITVASRAVEVLT